MKKCKKCGRMYEDALLLCPGCENASPDTGTVRVRDPQGHLPMEEHAAPMNDAGTFNVRDLQAEAPAGNEKKPPEGLSPEAAGNFCFQDTARVRKLLEDTRKYFCREGIFVTGIKDREIDAQLCIKAWEVFLLELIRQKITLNRQRLAVIYRLSRFPRRRAREVKPPLHRLSWTPKHIINTL